MKKVLVTGANGFLGRRLVEQLLERGHAVRAYCLERRCRHSGAAAWRFCAAT
jgi:nucleoside-diphosphate-sugar epimerase